MITFLNLQIIDFVNAQTIGNMTSKCKSGGECITIICLNDRPCETIKSNSSDITGLRDFFENRTKVTLIPSEIV